MEILILVLLAVAVFVALRHMKKNGVSCGGSCETCVMDCKKRTK